MIPPTTFRLSIAAGMLVSLWLWSWLAPDRTLPIAPQAAAAVSTAVPALPAPGAPSAREVDSRGLVEQPVFYRDRRAHPFRPGMADAPPPRSAGLDFELTTTVVGKHRAFAMLRLPGSNQSVVARPGQPFDADPAWQVTHVDRNSASFLHAGGERVTLRMKPPAPPSTFIPPAATMPAPGGTPTASVPAAAAATQPAQESDGLRARIDALRRAAASGGTGTQ